MRKFISKTFKDKTSVIELDLKEVGLMEDQSLAWRLQSWEKLFEVLAPASLAGERYYSYFLYDYPEACHTYAIDELTQEAKRTAEKRHTTVDKDLLQSKIDGIDIVMLEGKSK